MTRSRFKAAGWHLGVSALVASLAALLVFGLWYPYPYRDISGGRELFVLLAAVDVILGPLITCVVFNPRKSWRALAMDLSVIGLVQLSALGYGLHTMAQARPAYLVFEYSKFGVAHAGEIVPSELGRAPPALQRLPWFGPGVLSLRSFKDGNERFDATMAAIGGLPLSARPGLWQPYEAAREAVLEAAKPLSQLRAQPAGGPLIDAFCERRGCDVASLVYVPLVERQSAWVVVLEGRSAGILGYLPIDPY